jgi:hypothetical protein
MAYDQFGTNFKEKFRQGLKSILKYDIIFKSPIWGYSSVGSASNQVSNTLALGKTKNRIARKSSEIKGFRTHGGIAQLGAQATK